MNKRRKPQATPKLEDFLKDYDYQTLSANVQTLAGSLAWELFRAYLKTRQREFEVAALDMVRSNQYTNAAAHASGYAQACEDMADNFMQKLVDLVHGKTGVVEETRPEEIAS